jgi:hypothetical protein
MSIGSCPNVNSQEWKDILELNNGNVERAREEWDLFYGFDLVSSMFFLCLKKHIKALKKTYKNI